MLAINYLIKEVEKDTRGEARRIADIVVELRAVRVRFICAKDRIERAGRAVYFRDGVPYVRLTDIDSSFNMKLGKHGELLDDEDIVKLLRNRHTYSRRNAMANISHQIKKINEIIERLMA